MIFNPAEADIQLGHKSALHLLIASAASKFPEDAHLRIESYFKHNAASSSEMAHYRSAWAKVINFLKNVSCVFHVISHTLSYVF